MITRIEVDGFKSLRDFAVDLEPFTVLVGPNSAGKSNILDALALLSRLAERRIDEAFKQGRGRSIDQFTRRGGEAERVIRFAVEVRLPGVEESIDAGLASHRYRYELIIERLPHTSGAEQLVVRDESLRSLDDGQSLFARRSATPPERSILVRAGPKVYRAMDWYTALAGVPQSLADAPEGPTHLTSRSDLWPAPITAVAAELSSVRLLQLDAARLREPSERIGSGTLAPDASNLPTILADLPPPVLGEIRADLVALVPGIASFHIETEGDSFRIDFELSGGERLPARLVSDGTLRLLAILTMLRGEPRPSLIGIEEPENGVYPGRLRALLSFLQETALRQESDQLPAAPPPQVLLASHSPVVLAASRAAPQHLRFIDLVRRDGQLVTRARAVASSVSSDRGRLTVSLREIDALLDAADSEAAE